MVVGISIVAVHKIGYLAHKILNAVMHHIQLVELSAHNTSLDLTFCLSHFFHFIFSTPQMILLDYRMLSWCLFDGMESICILKTKSPCQKLYRAI